VGLTGWAERPLRPRALVFVVVGALVVLVVGFRTTVRPVDVVAAGGSDVTVYEAYGAKVRDGATPYRDFWMEYPPGAALIFVVPALVEGESTSADEASWSPPNTAARRYYRSFTTLVLLLLAAIVVLTAITLQTMRRSAGEVLLSLAVVATSPLLLGRLVPERFDAWPAALTAAALTASVQGWYRLGGVLLGFGAATKIYPAVLVPVLVIVVVRQRGAREAMLVAGAAVVATVAVFLPAVIASPLGTWGSLRDQLQSGLQIESVAGSVLVMTGHAAQALTALGLPPPSELSPSPAGHGLNRLDLAGSGVRTTQAVMSVLLLAALCLLWARLARSRSDPREDLLRYAAATVATALVLGSVLSPQYLIWLIPLVLLVGGRRGALASLCFVAAAILTRFWYPDGYSDYQDDLDAAPAALLLARNLALLATALVLILPAGWFRPTESTP
jgi:Glycosyltransferase family 87